MKFHALLFIAVLCSLSFCAKRTISEFEGSPFSVKPYSGMYELDDLKLEGFSNILAYGDFDNNKFTDLVTLDESSKTLTVHFYTHDTFNFAITTTITEENEIAAVMPGDFNYDGKLDLLVVTQTATKTILNYYLQSRQELKFEKPTASLIASIDGLIQPFIFDADGDRNLDIMFMENRARKYHVVSNSKISASQDFSELVSTETPCLPYSKVSNHKFASPHSNAFLDFNGDCAADLFITSVDTDGKLYFETWIRSGKKFCLVDVTAMDSDISLASFGDINKDGRTDLIYATQPSNPETPMTINVVYNRIGFDPKAPCTLGKKNSQMEGPFTAESEKQTISLPETYAASVRLYSPDPIRRPAKIRIGDINMDGFADLLFVLHDPKTEDAFPHIFLAINQDSKFDLTTNEEGDNAPYFNINGDAQVNLASYHVDYASFFDFDELGRLGLWVTVRDAENKASLLGIFNFVSSDNFILKTLGLNGYKEGDDIKASLGGVYYGSSVECKVTDLSGKDLLAKGTQMPQSAYSPLDLPYIFIGLGKTNNYVENFAMGITARIGNSDQQKQQWTPIIPNSQLIVNTRRNESWTLDVYVNPTSKTLMIVLIAVVILVILGGVIIYLHIKEKQEDQQGIDRMINVFG